MDNADMPAMPILGDSDAFALYLDGIKGGRNYGLTKREHFAAMAMQGFCADSKDACFEGLAVSSVKIADLLLKELDNE